MQIVQISDIHIGSLFNQNVFDVLVEEVNNLKPEAIVITGDLTMMGYSSSSNVLNLKLISSSVLTKSFWQETMTIGILATLFLRNSSRQSKSMNSKTR